MIQEGFAIVTNELIGEEIGRATDALEAIDRVWTVGSWPLLAVETRA